MARVSFSEACVLFDHATVWAGGHENYWYQRAWEALEKQGETTYDTKYEYYLILLKALAIIRVYDEFCEYAYEMKYNFSYWDLVDDVIPPFVLGQFVARNAEPEDFYEEDELESGLLNVLSDMQYIVFKAIGKELDSGAIYTWMYCTGFTPINWNAPVDDEDGMVSGFERYEITSYQEYGSMIDAVEAEILSDLTYQTIEAFNFVLALVAK